MYTSTPELFDRHLNIVDETGEVIHQGDIRLATSDPKEAFGDAELILVTMPATMMDAVSKLVYEFASSSAIIGVAPGNGGFECAFKKCIDRGQIFFGIERVPSVARLVQKGKVVKASGYRDELHVASLPGKYADQCAKIVESIFDKKTKVIPDYLNLTLTPSNPILHTTRLRTIFKDWHEGVFYDRIPLFYEEWDDETSELLFLCDEEVQTICRKLSEFELQNVKSLKLHYESSTVPALTKKLSSIPAFKGLKTPMLEQNGGFIPDLHSRYFTADFSYGLTIIKQIGEFAGVHTPNIDATLNWYNDIAVVKESFKFSDYGINDRPMLDEFYLR